MVALGLKSGALVILAVARGTCTRASVPCQARVTPPMLARGTHYAMPASHARHVSRPKGSDEHCFFTNWARFRFYPTKIPPFEPQFHAEFENEGPRACFLCVFVVACSFYIKKHAWNTVFSPTGHGLRFIQRKYHHSNGNFTLNSKIKVPGRHSPILMSFFDFFLGIRLSVWPST